MKIGIIGGGLMGRETASALARAFALDPVLTDAPELVAVADPHEPTLDWYRHVPTVTTRAANHHELLDRTDIDAVYVAVPHHLHEQIYLDVLAAGKDMLAEKPFGIDLASAQRISQAVEKSERFVRCSSEFPFYPIARSAFELVRSGEIGTPISGRCAFLHSSDLDANKKINWKRQVETCGAIGVMGDLGLHVCHLPFRLGIRPSAVFAQLQSVYSERPDGHGGMAACDTWDNATLMTEASWAPDQNFPFTFETKRIAPGEMNTWEFELIGTMGGVRISTKHPKTLWRFDLHEGEQRWIQTDVGSQSYFKTITGGIFEFGFSDAILQMWAAFALERAGELHGRFGCATPTEAVMSHQLFDAALRSHETRAMVDL